MGTTNILVILCLCSLAEVNAGVAEDALAEHNRLRDLHGVDPLTLNAELSKQASEYAAQLALSNQLIHSKSNGRYGENLCYVSRGPSKCTQSWYDEIKDYDFDKAEFSLETGHFTQLIWAKTTEMGYGEAQAQNGHYYVVVVYTPPGNMRGAFESNVPRLKDKKSGATAVSTNVILISTYYGLFKFLY